MAMMIPGMQTMEDFNWSMGEQRLYELLSQLPDGYVFFHSARWNEKRRRRNMPAREYIEWREADFVVFYPPRGILVVEVKDGNIWFDQTSGWHQQNRWSGADKIIDPMAQAQQSMFYFRNKLKEKLPYSGYEVNTAVWFTNADKDCVRGTLPNNYQPDTILWANDMASPQQAEMALRKVFDFYGQRHPSPTEELSRSVMDVIAPEFGVFSSLSSSRLAAQTLFHKMTREQSFLLDYLEEQATAAIHGCAGTGKTMLAIQKAKRLAEEGDPVLFLCFNSFLKDHLKEQHENENLTITNLDALYTQKTRHTLPFGFENASLKEEMLTEFLMGGKENGLNYRHIIVDEGQDFCSDHLEALHGLAQESDGCFYVFYDKLQFVQGKAFPVWIDDMECRLVLSRNCRNTKEIAVTSTRPVGIVESKIKTRYDLANNDMMFGKPKLYMLADKAALKEALDLLISKYVKAGVPKDSIVVLSMKAEGRSILQDEDMVLSQKNRLSAKREKNGIWFTTVRKFKGLEAEVVICIDVDDASLEGERQKNAFYVGTSRAQSYLEILTVLPDDSAIINFAETISGIKPGSLAKAKAAISSGLKVKLSNQRDMLE